ncbi:MmcQ/YjbR family DNA-binding protein [Occultella kanbiaonis]|uniref:MmcQ/YjbR family DNA-binding protein n=1 Tax=Occultella kanbiaonis TaxID=2675754 RepID=UPI0013D2326F|nr:MmcQ/YjbR family DNA-binding protein [Occultella kanbiaonis]
MREPATTPARVEDIHAAALAMPFVTVESAGLNPVYQVGGKSFVFFRNPRKDAFDPATGELYDDVIVIWVSDEADRVALVQDETRPFFTTPHFNGHPSVLIRATHVGQVSREEITELVQDAWLGRASRRRAKEWLAQHAPGPEPH